MCIRKKENCVFAGTFDPVTKGHENVIDKCLKTYARVFVVIGENGDKTPAFSLAERKEILTCALKNKPRVTVEAYSDYKDRYAEFLKENGITAYVRGIRSEKDIEYENAYLKVNAKLYPFVKTVYITPDAEFANISSSLVRETLNKGEDVSAYLSGDAYAALKRLTEKKQG